MAGHYVDIELIGHASLQKKFYTLEYKIQKEVMGRILRNAAKKLKPVSEAMIPVDSGRLRSAGLKVRSIPNKAKRHLIGVRLMTPTRAELGIDPNDKYYYPVHLELGHKTKGGGHVAAHPFLRDAADEMRPVLLKDMGMELAQEVERVMYKK